MKALDDAEIDFKDLQLLVYKENGIKFRTCPVSEHDFHGAVVRKVRAVQECLEKSEISNDLNNLPLGFSYGRDADNSPLLKLIFLNMLKIRRLNTRALNGPVRMPKGPGELMKRVAKDYSERYSLIPKLMMMSWHDTKNKLKVDDIIYF